MFGILTTLCLSALFSPIDPGVLFAGPEDHKTHAGYVDIDWSKAVGDKEPTVQVLLEPALLKLMAAAGKDVDPEVVELVKDLSFVRVNVYDDLPSESTNAAKAVETQVKALTAQGWSTVAKVRQDGDATVDVLMKVDGETIVGFAIFVAESDQLVFVNIAGNMDPETFGAKLGSVVVKVSGGEIKLDDLSGIINSVKGSTKDDGGL